MTLETVILETVTLESVATYSAALVSVFILCAGNDSVICAGHDSVIKCTLTHFVYLRLFADVIQLK